VHDAAVLEGVGLSAAEERFYRALIAQPGSQLPQLASAADLDLAAAAELVERLESLGLLHRDKDERLVALPPQAALESLAVARQMALEEARMAARQLQREFLAQTKDASEVVTVVTTPAEIQQQWEQLQSSATEEVLNFDAPPYIADPPDYETELRRLAAGVRYRVIYSTEALTLPGRLQALQTLRAAGEDARFLPTVPLKLGIADRRLAMLPLLVGDLHGVASALVVRESALLDVLVLLFDEHWRRATPLKTYEETASEVSKDDEPDPDEHRVLTLLAAGLKDEAIARQLGVTVRTVRRRVHSLTERLGCSTRFQAALLAQRRGWL
jgi:DNA-binding CsgD family transcriptional regulator